jgi:hypothetical protein
MGRGMDKGLVTGWVMLPIPMGGSVIFMAVSKPRIPMTKRLERCYPLLRRLMPEYRETTAKFIYFLLTTRFYDESGVALFRYKTIICN